MNESLARQIIWYGGMLSAIIGLLITIIQISLKGETPPEDSEESRSQKSFLSSIWVVMIITGILTVIASGFFPAKTGIRGAYISGIAGFFIPVFLVSMDCLALKKKREKDVSSLIMLSSVPLGGIGMSLLFMAFVISFYGIRAENLWIAFIAGGGFGLFLIRLAADLVQFGRYQTSSAKIESIMYMVFAVITATMMSVWHMQKTVSIEVFMPVILLVSIFLVTLITSALFGYKKNQDIMKILPAQLALYIILYLGFVVFIINKLVLDVGYSYPIICGVITSVILIIMVHNSSQSIKGVDLATGAFAVLLLISGLWFSYKWCNGYGITLYALGLMSVAGILVPHKTFETLMIKLGNKTEPEKAEGKLLQPEERDLLLNGMASNGNTNTKDKDTGDYKNVYDVPVDKKLTWPGLFIKVINFAGLFAIISGIFQVFLYSSVGADNIVDLGMGDVTIALLFGLFLPIVFEGFNLNGPNLFYMDKKEGMPGVLWRFIAIGAIIKVMVFTMGVIFRVEGIAGFILGLSAVALLALFSYIAQKQDKGMFRFAFSPAWITVAASMMYWKYLIEMADKFTRANKQSIVMGVMVLVAIIYCVSYYANRKRKPNQGAS
ncbi:MAG: hypothetical protein LWY06_15930 [Firmicutes bacterium]|nr:hypothetical protein [Bacillota bacterium]